MIQYKHASVAAFEGYAGASRSGFRVEIETERRLGQIDDISPILMVAKPVRNSPVPPPPGSDKPSTPLPTSFNPCPYDCRPWPTTHPFGQ
jgi:hypothetical protein